MSTNSEHRDNFFRKSCVVSEMETYECLRNIKYYDINFVSGKHYPISFGSDAVPYNERLVSFELIGDIYHVKNL